MEYSVYLLDDEEWLLESLNKSIEWGEYNTHVIGKSTNSVEAYQDIQVMQPDIVITDVRMPQLNGIELMKKLRAKDCKSVFIILSGYAEFEYVQEALQHEAISYCLKPLEEDKIIEALLKAQKRCSDGRLVKALKEQEKVQVTNESLQKICKYIQHNFTEELALQQIADMFFLNPSYLSNLFKKELGVTYSNYLAKIRLDYACNLLKKSDLPITQVAVESGFANYFYFARVFKKYKDLTPSQYREMA